MCESIKAAFYIPELLRGIEIGGIHHAQNIAIIYFSIYTAKTITYEKENIMKKVSFVNKIVSSIAAISLATTMGLTAFAAEDNSKLTVDIGGINVNVGELAEKNGVNPYALKNAIEKGLTDDKASPFSSLPAKPETVSRNNAVNPHTVSITAKSNRETKTNQDSTAYVAKKGSQTASGKTPAIGMCAMHVNVTTKTGNTSKNKIRLGTTIYMTSSISIKGKDYNSFIVEDRGTPDNRTKYWVDIYFGKNNTKNYNAAINYGVQTVSYYFDY